MKALPISEAKPHATDFELETRSGVVRHAARGSRKGWEVRLGTEVHKVWLPSSTMRKLSVDDQDVDVPRFGLRKRVALPMDGHNATLEMWTAFEPIGHWLRRSGPRPGLIGAVAGMLFAGAAGGAVAGTMRARLSRSFAKLIVDGVGAGAWTMFDGPAGAHWEYVHADEDLNVLASDWDRHVDLEFRAAADITTELDDTELAEALGPRGVGAEGRWVQVQPVGTRGVTVRIDRETSTTGFVVWVVKIPAGSSRRRAPLLAIGWEIEAEPGTGTRYFVRRFAASQHMERREAIRGIRSACQALDRNQARFEHWWLISGRAGTTRIGL